MGKRFDFDAFEDRFAEACGDAPYSFRHDRALHNSLDMVPSDLPAGERSTATILADIDTALGLAAVRQVLHTPETT